METLQRTLAIVKPDAVAKGAAGDIIATIENNGFRIIGLKMLHLKKAQAAAFYAVHVGKPFFDSLAAFMTSGPDRRAGAGKGQRHRRLAQADGRHQSGQRRGRHHPQEARREH